MKRAFIFILIFAVFFVLAQGEMAAEEMLKTPYGHIASYAALNYNTFDLSAVEAEDAYDLEAEEEAGVGFYGGIRHWMSSETLEGLALGAEIERIAVNYDKFDVSVTNLGLLGAGTYRLSEIYDVFPPYLYVLGAAGVYRGVVEDTVGELNTYYGPGLKLALAGSYGVHDNFKVGGRMGYRYSQPHSEGDLDFNGLEAGLQIEVSF